MTAEQIKATAGTVTCSQVDLPLYGKASFVALNQDDTKKGATSTNDITVTCGQTQFTVKSNTGVPVPAGATTTVTTTVQPPQPAK